MPQQSPHNLVGLRITAVRPMTANEQVAECWDVPVWGPQPIALDLDDGTVLYPARDEAGNGFGALFGRTPEGEPIRFTVTQGAADDG